MGWPKGKPRKGHVKQDGTPHAKKGERIVMVRKDPEPYKQTTKPVSEGMVAKTIKGITGQPVVEPCPNCGFAYADGGYCPECGWTKYHPTCPHCVK
jgi:hypothetical protein